MSIQTSRHKPVKRSVIVLSVLLVVLILGAIGLCGYSFWSGWQAKQQEAAQSSTPAPETPDASKEAPKVLQKNPVDFVQLKAQNPDIYSWIYIPGTNINLPVLQNINDDNFYLDHDVDGNPADEGAIYTQLANSTDYSDPVTVLYGHNMKANTMFTQLHYFENPEFFDENDTIYIYAPGRILTYRIVSAYLSDNKHILNSYDFTDPAIVQTYFDKVAAPDELIANASGITLNAANDKIIQLSTCSSDHDRRYIVTGVLVDEQPTA